MKTRITKKNFKMDGKYHPFLYRMQSKHVQFERLKF